MAKALVTRVTSARRAGIYGWLVSGLGLALGLAIVGAVVLLIYGAGEVSGLALGAAVAVIILGGLVLATVERWVELLWQWRRDLYAQSLADAAMEGDTAAPFVLYLRPFASTDTVQVHDLDYLPQRLPGLRGTNVMATAAKFELENEVRRATRPFGPMVALGAPLEHIGAGRILVDDAGWQEAILKLMDAAALIVLLPSSREGTRFEANAIIDRGLIEKTIIIDPPNRSSPDLAKYDHAEEWDQIQAAFKAKGLNLPDDDRRGRVYAFSAEGSVVLDRRVDADGSGFRPFLKRFEAMRRNGQMTMEGDPA